MEMVKIVVLGATNAGKRTFIRTIDRTNENALETISGMFGRLAVADDVNAYFFATSEEPHLQHLLPILTEAAAAYVLMIDSTDADSLSTGRSMLKDALKINTAPYVVAANKQDLSSATALYELEKSFGGLTKVLPCVANEVSAVKQVLLTVVKHPKIVEKLQGL